MENGGSRNNAINFIEINSWKFDWVRLFHSGFKSMDTTFIREKKSCNMGRY